MDSFKKLRTYNFIIGLIYMAQAIFILFSSNDFSLPVNTNYLKFDIFSQTLKPFAENIAYLKIGPLIVLFLSLSALAHFGLTLPTAYKWYVKNLKNRKNLARWFEYSLSSSVIIIVISMLVGVYDFSTLILIFCINAVMILCGLIMEVHNQTTEKVNWTSYIVGCFAGAIPWVIIALHLFGSGSENVRPLTFIYWTFFSTFLFFTSFALNMVLQYKKVGKWKDYLYGEKVYILLSFLAKSALAWQVFAGILRPI
jgi:glucose uptake protein GlcU